MFGNFLVVKAMTKKKKEAGKREALRKAFEGERLFSKAAAINECHVALIETICVNVFFQIFFVFVFFFYFVKSTHTHTQHIHSR